MARAEITDLLASVAAGDTIAQNRLFDLVYRELKGIARSRLRKSGRGLTINPTTLVHETWIKFSRLNPAAIENSAHFYNTMAQAMRHIVSDLVTKRTAARHGAQFERTELTDQIEAENKPLEELVAVNAALDKLRLTDAKICTVVEWHYFLGLSIEEIASSLEVSDRTAKRQLAMGRMLLLENLKP